jgi:putative transposase
VLRAYRYRLYPNAAQREWMGQHFGCVRYVYNRALAQKVEAYQTEGKSVSRFELDKHLTALKQAPETAWLAEVNSQSLQAALRQLDGAFTKFFREKKGFPRFKSKHRSRASFECPQNAKVDFGTGTLQLPKLGKVRAEFSRTFTGTVKTVTVSMTPTGKYFAAVLVDSGEVAPPLAPLNAATAIGIDVGLKDFATLSTGEKIANPRYLKVAINRLRRVARQHSQKQKGSHNREKSRKRLARCYEKVTNKRNDFLHQVSTRIVRENQTVCVENLNIAGLVKNHSLARAISDASWGTFLSLLRYKCAWYGKNYVEIGRFDPSSRLCTCGVLNRTLTLKEREWTCTRCGEVHDRDWLAARNIVRFALQKQNLIGQISRDTAESTLGEIPVRGSVNQESPRL